MRKRNGFDDNEGAKRPLRLAFYLGRESYRRIDVVMLVTLSVANELASFNGGQKLFGMLFKIDNFSGFGSHYDRIMD